MAERLPKLEDEAKIRPTLKRAAIFIGSIFAIFTVLFISEPYISTTASVLLCMYLAFGWIVFAMCCVYVWGRNDARGNP